MVVSSRAEIIELLRSVKDPEIPVVDIVELGILRDVVREGDELRIVITPTYSGCPAMQLIEQEIISVLKRNGIERAVVEKTVSPAWTSDWMTAEAKKKLKAYGIAPPGNAQHSALVAIGSGKSGVRCPRCDSEDTEQRSEFGATSCKALYYCRQCKEPFEYFKAF